MEQQQPVLKNQSGDVVSPAPSPSISPITEIRWRRRWEQVHDVNGTPWEVHEARATKHGFDLLFGFIANSRLTGRAKQKKQRVIPTQPLVAYWDAHRCDQPAIFDLPVTREAVKLLRRELGFNFFKDRRALWQERTDDLKNLSMREFAQRYDVDQQIAEEWRLRIIGRIARPADWWKDPAVFDVLCSSLPIAQVAKKLGLSRRHAGQLRSRALLPDNPTVPLWARPLPARWQTQAALEILRRSDVTSREIAAKLGISLGYAQLLRQQVRCLDLAA